MKGTVRVTFSAFYSSLLALGALLLVSNTLAQWLHDSAGQRFWAVFVSAYALALCSSGWVYLRWRATWAGLLHSGLMLAIAVMAVAALETGQVATPGRDDASAWVAADTALVVLLVAPLAAIFGILVMGLVFTSGSHQRNPDSTQAEEEITKRS